MRVPFHALTCLCLLYGGASSVQAAWFTLAGIAGDDHGDYVQVDPVTLRTEGSLRRLDIRVSRAEERTSTEGIRFRSFEGVAEVDCDAATARYVSATFHAEPHFAGAPIARLDYPSDRVRPVAFRRISGNFSARLVRAACVAGPPPSRVATAQAQAAGPGRDGTR